MGGNKQDKMKIPPLIKKQKKTNTNAQELKKAQRFETYKKNK